MDIQKDEQGYILLIILSILMVILSFGLLYLSHSQTQQYAKVRQKAAGDTMIDIRDRVFALIKSDEAWNLTLQQLAGVSVCSAQNPFACMVALAPMNAIIGVGSLPSKTTPGIVQLRLWNPANGAVAFDTTNPASGFTLNGNPCNTYSATPANNNCPIRLDISYIIRCILDAGVDTNCRNPVVTITSQFIYSPAVDMANSQNINTQFVFNLMPKRINSSPITDETQCRDLANNQTKCGDYSFEYSRIGSFRVNFDTDCTALGGTYVPQYAGATYFRSDPTKSLLCKF